MRAASAFEAKAADSSFGAVSFWNRSGICTEITAAGRRHQAGVCLFALHKRHSCALAALALASGACGRLPHDPEHTLDRVQKTHQVRIGVVNNPPWAVRTSGEPMGVEVELARRFAQSLGATATWYWGGEEEELKALEKFGLDMVIADVDAKTPWSKTVGITTPYLNEMFVVGVPAGEMPPESLQGLSVGVARDEIAAVYLIRQGARPVPLKAVSDAHGPVAAPDWLLKQMGFTMTRFELFKQQHVIAVPAGENEWLQRLDAFLEQHKLEVTGWLSNRAAE